MDFKAKLAAYKKIKRSSSSSSGGAEKKARDDGKDKEKSDANKSKEKEVSPAFRSNGKPLVDFFIVGAQKAGTMAAVLNMNKHPDIFVLKECHFFDSFWDKGVGWYRNQLAKSSKPIVGEKTPELIYIDICALRMKMLCPNAKFILCIRDPIKRAYSNWNMQKPVPGSIPKQGLGVEDLNFDDAIDRELKSLMGEKRSYGTALYHYIQRGFYMDQIERFLKVFPDKSRLLIVVAEHMRKNPQETYDKLYNFVGAKPYKVDAEDDHVGSYGSSKMSERVRKRLIKVFAPHNERLFKFLGYRIDEWQMPESEEEEEQGLEQGTEEKRKENNSDQKNNDT